MNDKTAKRLRRIVRSKTEGWPLASYERDRRTGAIELVARCTRYQYRRLKRAQSRA